MRLGEIMYNFFAVPGPLSSKSMFSQLYYAAEKEQGESRQISTSKEKCG